MFSKSRPLSFNKGNGKSEAPPGCQINCWLLKAIDPGNIRLRGTRMEMHLWTEWPQMLADLPALGITLAVSRNASAVLGRKGVYPDLEFSCDGLHARSGSGSFDIDFPPWHSPLAVAEERAGGFAHFVEFRDVCGEVMHKVCLTERSRGETFVHWVQQHQSIGTEPFRAGEIPSQRWHTVQQRHSLGIEEADDVGDSAVLLELLQAAIDRQVAIRLIAGNEGVVQSANMSPKRVHPSGGWMFASDDESGLHFNPASISSVIVHHLPAMPNHPAESVLKCFDEHGALCLAVAAPCPCAIPGWNDLLQSVLPKS
jgi:putative heme degradation protein